MARPGVHGTFSQPGPSHPAAGVRLARTLGVSQTASVACGHLFNLSAPLTAGKDPMPQSRFFATGNFPRSPSVAVRLPAGSATCSPTVRRADSRFLFSDLNPVARTVAPCSSHPRPPAPPNPSLNHRTPNGRLSWPGLGYAVHFPSPGQAIPPPGSG